MLRVPLLAYITHLTNYTVKGLHVKEIAAKSGLDPKKLGVWQAYHTVIPHAKRCGASVARILRFLATNHWFIEVAPDVFANNLLSSLRDTGKEIGPNLCVRYSRRSEAVGC